MVAIRRILCPTDFSDFSRRALDHAVAPLLRAGPRRGGPARLLLLHVVEGWAEGAQRDLSHWTVPEYRRFLEKEASERLHAAVEAADRSAH